jgi:hypothetical protein
VQVTIPWLEDRPEAYYALCKLWVSPKYIAKSEKNRWCRGSSEGYMYGPDGHIPMTKCLISKICIKIYVLQYIYATNSYPQESETDVASHDIQVFKRGHKGDGPSQPDKLCTEVATSRLVSC